MLDGTDVTNEAARADSAGNADVDLGPVADIRAGSDILVHGRKCLALDSPGPLRLVSAACPHMGGEVIDAGSCFQCPLHGWTFDKKNGKSITTAGAALSEIPTFEKAGRLYAKRSATPRPNASRSNPTRMSDDCAPETAAADLSVQLLAHSCLSIQRNSFTLLTDPWLAGPAMLGAWTQYPPPLVRRIDPMPDAVWISHEHSDHFHEPTLQLLDRKTPIYFPDFPNQRIEKRLAALGFLHAHPMPFGQRRAIAPDVHLTCYEPASLWNDSILLIELGRYRLLNLNDAGLNRRLADLLGPVDAVASAFTPGASGYPLTWNHLTEQKQDEILQRSCTGMLQMLREAVKLYGCRSIIPYAGHFSLWHPIHRKFARRMKKNSLDDVVSAMADLPVQVVDLLPGETWQPAGRKITRVWKQRERLFDPAHIQKYVSHTFDATVFDRHHAPDSNRPQATPASVDAHFLHLNDVPEMVFCEDLTVAVIATDLTLQQTYFERLYHVESGRLRVIDPQHIATANLTMRVPLTVLSRIVNEDLSWDESHIGYWCGFSRSPDVFHGGFWRLLQAPYYRKPAGALPGSPSNTISAQACIGSLIEQHGPAAERILRRYGLYCGGCHRASAETLAQAAATHGIDALQSQRLVDELNSAFATGAAVAPMSLGRY